MNPAKFSPDDGADASARPGKIAAVPSANWPGAVRWPGSPGFEESAKAWLFDLLPARFRYEEILHRRPAELAHLVRLRLEADIAATLTGIDAMRERSRPHDPIEMPYLFDLYARERAWASAMLKQVALVERRLAAVERDRAAAHSPRAAEQAERTSLPHLRRVSD